MIKEFELTNGKLGSITIDDQLIEIMGEEWAQKYVEDYVSKLEEEIKSQE
jgi:hypothetical protein